MIDKLECGLVHAPLFKALIDGHVFIHNAGRGGSVSDPVFESAGVRTQGSARRGEHSDTDADDCRDC
jgi:hypothetical protein